MKDPDIELSKWKQERKQGRLRFVVPTATPVIVGMMIWWSIEPMFISETPWGWAQTIDILSKGFGAVVGARLLVVAYGGGGERESINAISLNLINIYKHCVQRA